MFIRALIRFCLGGGQANNIDTRKRCGTVASGVAVALNLFLFATKAIAGVFAGSVSILADAVNNLSDAATSLITLVGFRMAGQQADAEHPFGHGRMEYVAGLIVSLAVILMGLEVGRAAIGSIFDAQPVTFTMPALAILCLGMAIKLWMYFFQRHLGREIDSPTLLATAADSLSDVAATAAVLVSVVVNAVFSVPVDAIAGLMVSVLIMRTGWQAAKQTLDPLLGRAMSAELARDIDTLVLGHKDILGMHDLIYHDYGAGRAMMSFHAEVPADGDFLALHDTIDHIERELKRKHCIETVIHMDPVVRDARTTQLYEQVSALAAEIDPAITIHDFRITAGPSHTNLIFDLVVPYGARYSDAQVVGQLTAAIERMGRQFYAVIEVDHSYIDGH